MYLPGGRESSLHLPTTDSIPSRRAVNSIVANRERNLVAVATDDSIYIWLSHPQLLLFSLGLGEAETLERGALRDIYWRFDSSAIAVTTTRNQILVYAVKVSEESCYNLKDSDDASFQRTTQELFLRGSRPVVQLVPSVVINLAAAASCCVPSRDELLVCVRNGFAHHVSWTGNIDAEMSFRLSAIPFANDQLQSKPEYVSSRSVYIADAVYAPLVGGYCVVLSDGRAALLTSADALFRPNSLLGVWAANLKDAVCCDVNHKFRLLVFGCRSGDVCAHHLDEANGSLVQTFRVSLKVTNGPEITNRIGPVSSVRVLSSGSAFVVVWAPKTELPLSESISSISETSVVGPTATQSVPTNRLPPTAAVFTPFGSQTFCTLEGCIEQVPSTLADYYTTAEWGPEGLQLWLGRGDGLVVMPMVHAAACNNPVMEHMDRAVLLSDSSILISPARPREKEASAPHSVWQNLAMPHEYLASNWPIRFVSIDREFRHVVIAGTHGIAHCSLASSRWKIFGNESQERDLIVTGGVCIFGETAGVACCSASDDKPQMRFFALSTKLDNRYASFWDLEARALLIAQRCDILAIFDTAARVLIYRLTSINDGGRDSYPKISMELLAEIRMRDLVAHPACVVSLQLTQLNLDGGQAKTTFAPSVDTVLVNVAGRLITLSANPDDENGKFILNQPMVVASFVEQMWHDSVASTSSSALSTPVKVATPRHMNGVRVASSISSDSSTSSALSPASPHLSNALWIACGAKGIRVWLPLIPGRRSTSTQDMTFIAKRIMLPFDLDIYPIVMCARDCLAIGVESVSQQILRASSDRNVNLYGLHRNSEVFVHHLLRQLLKRNLGVFALEVAGSCRSLPHFSHALELLLHGVLEEEATSSEPIPDPLLPRCVAFIQEFPEFLRTIAHCARKTELALWPALFAVTGSPNDLFEVCIRDGELDTAASYLIVLQNIESSQTSMDQAARLLREALSARKWAIARDMMRFTRSIDADDIDSPSRTPPPTAKTSLSRRPTVSSPNSISDEASDFVFNRFQAGAAKLNKVRHSHTERDGLPQPRKDSTGSSGTAPKTRVSRAQSGEISSPASPTNRMASKMESILEEHARHLLNECYIRDLGFFWAELDFDLPGLLHSRRDALFSNEQKAISKVNVVENFCLALTRLHSQFAWPYPVAGGRFVHQLEKKLGSLRTSHSSISLNGMVANDNTAMDNAKCAISSETVTSSVEVTKTSAEKGYESSDSSEVHEARLEKLVGTSSEEGNTSTCSRPASPTSSTTPSETRSIAGDWQADLLVGETLSGVSSASRAQLDFLLDLFADALTVDWIFLLCVLRRDETRLRREFSVSVVHKCGALTFAKLRQGCHSLFKWALEDCVGYVPILQAFCAHVDFIALQAGVADIKLTSTSLKPNGETPRTSRSESVTKRDFTTKNSKLGAAFSKSKPNGNWSRASNGTASRHRSRSVDRGTFEEVVSTSDVKDEDGCVIM